MIVGPDVECLVGGLKRGERQLTYDSISGRDAREAERIIDAFLVGLRRMTPAERAESSHEFTRWERWVWASRFPEEISALEPVA